MLDPDSSAEVQCLQVERPPDIEGPQPTALESELAINNHYKLWAHQYAAVTKVHTLRISEVSLGIQGQVQTQLGRLEMFVG